MTKLVPSEQLSANQLRAVQYPMQPVAVIAGAGSGKTTVMAERVLYLIEQAEVESIQVLGLTFTNKAASQLRSRIVKRLGSGYEDKLPTISTYHAFARQLLLDHGSIVGIEPDHKTLTDTARAQLALAAVQQTNLEIMSLDKSTSRVVEMVLHLDDLLAEHLLEAADVSQSDQNWISELSNLIPNADIRTAIEVAGQRIEILAIVEEFRALKLQMGVVDFADQLRFAVELLKQDNSLVEQLKDKYRCVLLDEYQDTSVAQQQMLLLAFGKGHSVTAVGDPLQSIYAWRGASAETTRSFGQQFCHTTGEAAEILSLGENYRSAGSILQAANKLIAPIRAENPGAIELTQGKSDLGLGEVKVGCFEKNSDEIAAITEQIDSLLRAAVRPADIAVLGRTTGTLLKVHQALTASGIPAALVGVETIAKTPEVVEIISLIEAAADPTANSALARLLISPRLNIGDRDLAALADRAVELANLISSDPTIPIEFNQLDTLSNPSLADALDQVDQAEVSDHAKTRMRQLAAEIDSIRNINNALDAVFRAINILNLDIELHANPSSKMMQRFNVVAGFIELVKSWSNSSDDQSVLALLAWIRTARRFESVPKIDVPIVSGAVALLTIHRAKGLEWPHVFVPEVTVGVFPTSQSRSVFTNVADAICHSLRGDRNSLPPDPAPDKKSITQFKQQVKEYAFAEELRLAYVAFTRAQNSLTVTCSWWGDTQKTLRGPSVIYDALAASATGSLSEVSKPIDSENPYLEVAPIYRSQPDTVYVNQIRELANQVDRTTAELVVPAGLNESEIAQLVKWDRAINWLLNPPNPSIELPYSLTATNLINAVRNPIQYIKNYSRPMPKQPTAGATFGTLLHAKIENYYKQPALFDLDDLAPKSHSPDLVKSAFAAFETSTYAQLQPIEVEWTFQLPLAQILIPGRVDAVYLINGKPVLIDWKTGKPSNADQLQLAIYKLAWSHFNDVPLSEIGARFVFLPDLTEIEATEDLNSQQVLAMLLKN